MRSRTDDRDQASPAMLFNQLVYEIIQNLIVSLEFGDGLAIIDQIKAVQPPWSQPNRALKVSAVSGQKPACSTRLQQFIAEVDGCGVIEYWRKRSDPKIAPKSYEEKVLRRTSSPPSPRCYTDNIKAASLIDCGYIGTYRTLSYHSLLEIEVIQLISVGSVQDRISSASQRTIEILSSRMLL
jgi:hypothetical protein